MLPKCIPSNPNSLSNVFSVLSVRTPDFKAPNTNPKLGMDAGRISETVPWVSGDLFHMRSEDASYYLLNPVTITPLNGGIDLSNLEALAI